MKKIRLFAFLVVAAVLLCSCNSAVTVLPWRAGWVWGGRRGYGGRRGVGGGVGLGGV